MGDSSSGVECTRIGPRLLEWRVRGHVTRHSIESNERIVQQILATQSEDDLGVDALVDGVAMQGHEPGLPGFVARWSHARPQWFRRVALVGREDEVHSVARAFQLLVPAWEIASFTDRDEALRFLEAADAA